MMTKTVQQLKNEAAHRFADCHRKIWWTVVPCDATHTKPRIVSAHRPATTCERKP